MTLPSDVLESRLAKARTLAATGGHGALLLCSAPRRNGGQSAGNVAYFTGYLPLTGTVLLLVPATGRPIVMTPGLNERRMLAARLPDFFEVRQTENVGTALGEALQELGLAAADTVGTAGAMELSAGLWHSVTKTLGGDQPSLVPLDHDVHMLREEVSPADLDYHRKASAISDNMLTTAFALAAEPGMTPARLMAEVEHAGRLQGAEIARLWLATGPNPAVTSFEFFELPQRIIRGDRVQLGTTVSVEGRYSQGLRMAIIGEPSQALAEAVDTLLMIQDRVAALMVPGRPAHEVSDLLEAMIDEACPYTRRSDPFRFQSCHQLGLDYSDAALANALHAERDRSRDPEGPRLRAGQVLEIHPNYTLPGLGHICAGDAIAVTDKGGERLTRFPRGLTLINPRDPIR